MSSSSRLRGAGLLTIMLATSACMPSASVKTPEVDDVSWDAIDAHIDVQADNPWPIDIKVKAVEGTVTVGEVEVLHHRDDTPVTVEAFSERKVRFPFSVKTEALLAAAESVMDAGATPYLLDGTVTLDTPVGDVDVPLSSAGVLPAIAQPTASLPDIKVKAVSLTEGTADLVFIFKVDNPNDLELAVRQVEYGARITGLDVISGQTPGVELAAASVSTLRLPVHLDAGAVVRGLGRAVQKGRLKGEAFLLGKVRTPWGTLPLDLERTGQLDFK